VEAVELFEILVRENSKMLRTYLISAVRDASNVDDLWQETMVVAWRRIDDFDRSRPFGPWLRGIAAKVVLAHSRKMKKVITPIQAEDLEYLSSRMESFSHLTGDTFQQKLNALRDCTESLKPNYEEVVRMRFLDGLMTAAISEAIGQGLETVKKRLARAKVQLLQCIDRKMEAAGP